MLDVERKKLLGKLLQSVYWASLTGTSIVLSSDDGIALLDALATEKARGDKWRKVADESQAEYGEKLTELDLSAAWLSFEKKKLESMVEELKAQAQADECALSEALNAPCPTCAVLKLDVGRLQDKVEKLQILVNWYEKELGASRGSE